MLKQTVFHDFHIQHNARMVDFAGWDMPLLYKNAGIIAEHIHTRTAASIFDVSHMGRVKFTGKDSGAFLSRILTRNIEKSAPGQSMYSLVCNDQGGILDDVIVSRYDAAGTHWLMVCNASNREKILAWCETQKATLKMTVAISDETFDTSMVAIQGPKAVAMLDALLPEPLSSLKRYHFEVQKYMMIVSFSVFRSGYTGEDGAEIILGNTAAGMAMKFLTQGGEETAILKPAGLGARDTLRMEAGMPLYGHELSEQTDPLSASLAWAVDLNKNFIGVEALRKIHAAGLKRKLVGLLLDGPRSARQGMAVLSNDKNAGEITSATSSPTLKRPIAIAYIDAALAAPGTPLTVNLGATTTAATVTPLPFYKKPK